MFLQVGSGSEEKLLHVGSGCSAHLSFGTLLVGWIHEDAPVGDGAVHVGHHGAHIPGAVGGAAILQGREGGSK